VDSDELVFFANWVMQAGGVLHRHTAEAGERRHAAALLHELQGEVIDTGFYDAVKMVGWVGGDADERTVGL